MHPVLPLQTNTVLQKYATSSTEPSSPQTAVLLSWATFTGRDFTGNLFGKTYQAHSILLLHSSAPNLVRSNKHRFVKVCDFIYRKLQLLLDLASKVGSSFLNVCSNMVTEYACVFCSIMLTLPTYPRKWEFYARRLSLDATSLQSCSGKRTKLTRCSLLLIAEMCCPGQQYF